jgi:toxin ParE1/3/4
VKIDFSRAAEADISAINRDEIRRFGLQQAALYAAQMAQALQLIAEFPLASPTKAGPDMNVRVRPFGVHVILYELRAETAWILRVRHGHEDWQGDF